MELPVLEMPDTVVFPGMTLLLAFTEPRHLKLLNQVLRQEQHGFMISWAGDNPYADSADRLPAHGTRMAVLAVSGNEQEGFAVTAHGQGRQHLKLARSLDINEPAGGHSSLLFVHDEPAPLLRTDPGEELLEAWDTVELFQEYARKFFRSDLQEEVRSALPDDPLYTASFVCANALLEPYQQQLLLAAPTLVARLRLVRSMIRDELAGSAAAQTGSGRP